MITNKINNKKYIGKTLRTIEKRWQEHQRECRRSRDENRPLYRAFKKYGIENFQIEQLTFCTAEEASEKEQFFIELYETYKNGYNATLGGDGQQTIDHNEVINIFKKTYSELKTAQILNIDAGTVRGILKSNNIKTPTTREAKTISQGKQVCMSSKDGKEIQTFDSITYAADFIAQLQNRKRTGFMMNHITDVCNGIRKSAYGYKWKFVNTNDNTSNA